MTVKMISEPRSPRQLGDEGLVVFWRDGREPGRRQGLAAILSMCPHPECACQLVYLDGFVIDDQATAVSWDEDGVHVTLHADTAPPRVTLDKKMIAIVDPCSGETTAHPEFLDAIDPALVDWLGSEMDEELLEVLHRYRVRAKATFDVVLTFSLPSIDAIADLLRLRLPSHGLSGDVVRSLAARADGLSFADVARTCDDAIRFDGLGR